MKTKRFIALIFALTMIFMLSACKDNNTEPTISDISVSTALDFEYEIYNDIITTTKYIESTTEVNNPNEIVKEFNNEEDNNLVSNEDDVLDEFFFAQNIEKPESLNEEELQDILSYINEIIYCTSIRNIPCFDNIDDFIPWDLPFLINLSDIEPDKTYSLEDYKIENNIKEETGGGGWIHYYYYPETIEKWLMEYLNPNFSINRYLNSDEGDRFGYAGFYYDGDEIKYSGWDINDDGGDKNDMIGLYYTDNTHYQGNWEEISIVDNSYYIIDSYKIGKTYYLVRTEFIYNELAATYIYSFKRNDNGKFNLYSKQSAEDKAPEWAKAACKFINMDLEIEPNKIAFYDINNDGINEIFFYGGYETQYQKEYLNIININDNNVEITSYIGEMYFDKEENDYIFITDWSLGSRQSGTRVWKYGNPKDELISFSSMYYQSFMIEGTIPDGFIFDKESYLGEGEYITYHEGLYITRNGDEENAKAGYYYDNFSYNVNGKFATREEYKVVYTKYSELPKFKFDFYPINNDRIVYGRDGALADSKNYSILSLFKEYYLL